MNTQFAIVISEYNQDITDKLLEGALDKLIISGIPSSSIAIIKVPGAIEIPLVTKVLAKSKRYQAIICLGAVIRGDTDHYDYVCQQVSYGCQKIMLDFEIPIIFGILTTNTLQQAEARVDVNQEGHKGIEAAEAALTMVKVISQLD